jgi:hypothetical protein
MSFKPLAFSVLVLLSACGGSTKPTATPVTEASASTEATPEADSSKSENPSTDTKPAEPEPEATCEKDSDCTIFADCCSCRAVSAKAPLPPSCDSVCGESKCEVKSKTIDNVACVSGRCKLK